MAKRIFWRAAMLAAMVVLATSAPYYGSPIDSITAAPAPGITSKASGLWGASTTWSCSCVPTATSVVTILSGHTITMSGTGSAAGVTVEGILKASRTAGSTLNLSGNLIVTEQGVLDYGTPASPLPANVTATISWSLDESKYVGGSPMAPVASDVGLWVVEQGRVFTNGPDRGAWTLLTASALKGATQLPSIRVLPWGGRPGMRLSSAPATRRPLARTIAYCKMSGAKS